MIDRYREEARAERERNGEAAEGESTNANRHANGDANSMTVDVPPELEDVSEEERKSQSLNTSTTVVGGGETLLTYNTATDQSNTSMSSKRRDS